MAATTSGQIHLEVVTPNGLVCDESVTEVVARGVHGQFGARPGHQPYLVRLLPGPLRYSPVNGGGEKWLSVLGGLAEVQADRVIVLADASEEPHEIDKSRAEAARKRAKERLAAKAAQGDVNIARAQAALMRAQARLDTTAQ